MSTKIKWLILGSIVAFLILSGIQYYLIQNSYHYKISAFEKEVKDKASWALHDIRFDSLTLLGSNTARFLALDYYDHEVEREDLLDSLFLMRTNHTLNHLLVAEFRKEMHNQEVEFGGILTSYILFDTISNKIDTIFSEEVKIENMLFGNLSSFDDAIYLNGSRSSTNLVDAYSVEYYFSIRNWKSKVLQRMWRLIALSVFILLSVIALFIYTLRSWLQQKKINEVKNDFINNITHEFKTPLTTLSIASKTLRNPMVKKNDNIYLNTLNSIDRQNVRLQKLIDQVMTQSLGSTELVLKKEIVQDDIFMNEIVDDFEISLQNQKVKINCNIINSGMIKVDRFYLTTAIVNVLDNAFKYGGRLIEINVNRLESNLSITIIDNGIGIAQKDQDEIFEKFYRVSTGDRHDVKGLGLGLYYTKSIVLAHQGHITVFSEGVGKGAQIELTLQNVYV